MSNTPFTWMILILIQSQGDDPFRKRELATKLLDGTLPYSAELVKHGGVSKDPEMASRCNIVYDRWWGTESWRLADKCAGWKYCWLDQLPSDWQGENREVILDYYLSRAKNVTKKRGEHTDGLNIALLLSSTSATLYTIA